jgi:hypothetical protein
MDGGRYLRWAWLPVLAATASSPGQAVAAPAVGARVTGVYPFERGLVALAGERIHVATTVRDSPPGSAVVLRLFRSGRQVAVRRHGTGARTTFADVLRVPCARGPLTIRVWLAAPTGQTLARRSAVRLGVLQPTASDGARGLRVRFLQRRLAALRYAIAVTGRYDDATRRAVIAYHKVNRMARTTDASRAVFVGAARGVGGFRPRRRGAAHVEGDLSRQVLALVNRGGRVFKVYMTSSGRDGLNTPTGVHTFYRKAAGWNAEGMLDSSYFTYPSGPRTACAIHGYPFVPTWNDSHCCFRVPVPDARKIFNWVRVGERIYVYY